MTIHYLSKRERKWYVWIVCSYWQLLSCTSVCRLEVLYTSWIVSSIQIAEHIYVCSYILYYTFPTCDSMWSCLSPLSRSLINSVIYASSNLIKADQTMIELVFKVEGLVEHYDPNLPVFRIRPIGCTSSNVNSFYRCIVFREWNNISPVDHPICIIKHYNIIPHSYIICMTIQFQTSFVIRTYWSDIHNIILANRV